MDSRKLIPLKAVRDLLAPDLHGAMAKGQPFFGIDGDDVDLQVDDTNDRLLVKAGKITGIVSRNDIQSGRYKAKWRYLLTAMGEAIGSEKKEIRMEEIT